MTTIHIKTSNDVSDKLIDEIMNILLRENFKAEKYQIINGKIVIAKKMK